MDHRNAAVGAVFIAMTAAVVLWWAALQTVGVHDGPANYLFNTVYGIPFAVGGAIGLMRVRAAGGMGSVLGFSVGTVSAASLSFGIGLFVWTGCNVFLSRAIPSPGMPDVFFVLYYLLTTVGLTKLIGTVADRRVRSRIIIALPFVMVGLAVTLAFLWTAAAGAPFGTAVMNSVYVALDSILVVVSSASILSVRGALGRSFALISAGVLAESVGGLFYIWRTSVGTYWNGDISDGLLALGAILTCAGLVFFTPWRESRRGGAPNGRSVASGPERPISAAAPAPRQGAVTIKEAAIVAAFLTFAVYLVWWTKLQFSSDHEDLQNYLFNLLYGLPPALAALAVVATGRMAAFRGGAIGRVKLQIAASLLAFGIGQIVWTYFNLALSTDLPSPSVADAFYLAYYVFMVMAMIGLLVLNRGSAASKYLMYVLPVSMIATGAVLAVILPASLESGIGLLTMNTVYVVGDIAIITLAAVNLLAGGGLMAEAVAFLLAGTALVSVGDVIYAYRSGIGVYWNGDISDGFLALGSLLSTLALLLIAFGPGGSRPAVPTRPRAPEASRISS